MRSTIAIVVGALSTSSKVGLAVVGGLFIAFALISSFVLPRRNPNFPGKNLGWYIVVCVLFFVAMISAVLYFGREPKEKAAEAVAAHTSTAAAPTTTAPAAAGGDATAGKAVFTSAGCSGCHTLKAAGA